MKLKQKIFSFMMIIIFLFVGAGAVSAAGDTVVAVTILPQIEMVKAVAGDRVEVIEMIPQGFSPSNYAPSPAEMRAFDQASIYFSIGVPADIQNILPRAEARDNLKIVKLFQEIESKYPHHYFGEPESEENADHIHADHGHSHAGGRDPHIWLSPARAQMMVKLIRDHLINILPEYELEFKQNTKNYLEKINQIDQANKKLLASYQGQKILVYHPAFGYFVDHYDLEMIAIEEAGKEPGPRYLEQIIELAKSQQIKTVFHQAEIDSNKTRAVAEELAGKRVELDPLAKNYSENLKLMAQKIAAVLAERADN
ncbi:periplasmic solute binding protein [Halanaerobium praevalens DSM 2228]|uniref:Periplasmic solute binding protein n=1 Tax=Halanaerobium praevalens (strain ATCC 33744 / DSM 2228 / GSL) TaxID=572479 RepID=E3DMM4_HALPG|nr:zinc ABC transporter substrate-binding protein [Halanaerobium praevalens]ADO76348.1 periplasmic solute binding protein [Halanaerobium praevalens DSM 2228]